MQESSIGLGTAAIGRPQYINIKKGDNEPFSLASFKQKGLDVLNHAYNSGVRYFDTAPGYGMAEELIIDWVGNQNDPEITVATKWGYTYVADFNPTAKVHEIKEHSLNKLNEQWETSKQLLPNLKYYQIHSATLESGVLENKTVLDRLFELREEYNIKVGLTTTGSNQSEVLKKALNVHLNGVRLFDIFQCTYNILDQSIYELGREIISDKKQLVIKEALANGRLFPHLNYPNYTALYETLRVLAKKYKTGIDAIALQFCLAKLKGATVLSGAGESEHLEQNLKAAQMQLNAQEMEELTKFETSPEAYWNERRLLTWN